MTGWWLGLVGVALLAQQPRDLRLEPVQPANPLGDRGSRYALVIGISKYEYLPPAAQLRFAHRDAEDFAGFLRSASGGMLPSGHIRVLTNEQATLAAIRAALHQWLPGSAGAQDIVYVFFAGHGVLAERDEGYLVAHDSDAQNLHATALPFAEVDQALSEEVRAGLVILAMDACHSGRIGWTSYSASEPGRVAESIAAIGRGDRAFLKLLASRPSERSFEDERWSGGHGIFTFAMLEGLGGKANRDNDGLVRTSELIDYVGRIVPEETRFLQHPRVAGTFDARLPLAVVPVAPPPAPNAGTLDISGIVGTGVYIDNVFRGNLRRDGTLRVEGVGFGSHGLSADLGEGRTLEGRFTIAAVLSQMQIPAPRPTLESALRAKIAAGQVLEPGGAWDLYRAQGGNDAQRAAAAMWLSGALEELGQACVSDYVQSTQIGPKRTMLARASAAYGRLRLLRPRDKGLEARALFCQARLQIASRQFETAVATLQEALRADAQFACAYNALGVALEGLNRPEESRRAFERAAQLTPEWALPPFQIAQQFLARNEVRQALPYLERAVRYNPRSAVPRWNLMRAHRVLGRLTEVETDAAELTRLSPGYAPTYLELGRAYEAAGNAGKAADAYETYLLLAPNFADSDEIRRRVQRERSQTSRPVPSLRNPVPPQRN